MFQMQKSAGSDIEYPILMWNPPWLLFILEFLIWGDFETAAYVWLLTSITIYSASVLLISNHYKAGPGATFLMLAASSVFIPIHTSLMFGQLGAILLFGTTLYFIGIMKNNAFLEGAGLFLLSTKPHLLYLLILARFFLLAKQREFIKAAISLAPSIFIIGMFCILSPTTISEWLYALTSTEKNPAGGIEDWIVASFTGFIRNISFLISGNSIPWIMILIPSLGIIVVTYLVFTDRISKNPERYFPLLTTASLFFNPYGWISDSTCLLLIPLLLIVKSPTNKTLKTTLYLVLLQLCILPLVALFADQQHWLFWYPLAVYFFWIFLTGYLQKCSIA